MEKARVSKHEKVGYLIPSVIFRAPLKLSCVCVCVCDAIPTSRRVEGKKMMTGREKDLMHRAFMAGIHAAKFKKVRTHHMCTWV